MDKRQAEPPTYEVREDVRRLCFGLWGPRLEHPMRDYILHGPNDLMGEDARRWQKQYRRKKAEEESQPEHGKKRGKGKVR